MKLTIFGATGRTGFYLVKQALDQGHEIRACGRKFDRIQSMADKIEFFQMNGSEEKSFDEAIKDCDAVLSVIGHGKNTPPDMQEKVISNIIQSMKKFDVNRIIALTGAGVREIKDQPKLSDRIVGGILKLAASDILQDSIRYSQKIKQSGLAWTLVRAPRLTEGPQTGKYTVGMVDSTSGMKISRADIADFMLKALNGKSHTGETPMVSYGK